MLLLDSPKLFLNTRVNKNWYQYWGFIAAPKVSANYGWCHSTAIFLIIHLFIYSFYFYFICCLFIFIYFFLSLFFFLSFFGGAEGIIKVVLFLEKSRFCLFNALKPRQNGCHFTDDTFKCSSLNENVWILIDISLNFVPNDISPLVQTMAWCQSGNMLLSELKVVISLMYICVTQPQWV